MDRQECLSYSPLQILVEEVESALPGKLGGGFVISRRRIVVETMIRALIYIFLVVDVIGFQGIFPRRKSPR